MRLHLRLILAGVVLRPLPHEYGTLQRYAHRDLRRAGTSVSAPYKGPFWPESSCHFVSVLGRIRAFDFDDLLAKMLSEQKHVRFICRHELKFSRSRRLSFKASRTCVLRSWRTRHFHTVKSRLLKDEIFCGSV